MIELNNLFDMVVRRDLFDCSEDGILQSIIKSYVGNFSFLDEKKGETIYIITDNVRYSSYDFKTGYAHITLNKHITLKNFEQFEFASLNMEGRTLRVFIYDIDQFKSDYARGIRAETIILDIYEDENIKKLNTDFINKCLRPMNIYKRNKPCHGMILIK